MGNERFLVVTADDFGIGPETTRGILDLAAAGVVTSSVLLVNSPHAEDAVRQWRKTGQGLELGWHACLTLDRPVTAPRSVPTLVNRDGCFWSLGEFIRRIVTGKIRTTEIEIELRGQCGRFRDLIGLWPPVVNFHHHLQVFTPVGAVLRRVLGEQHPAPYVRRVREPWLTRWCIPGARLKRVFLSSLGGRESRRQARAGFPGNEWLAGLTDLVAISDPGFLVRWLTRIPGRFVELMCHPGYSDWTIVGRDCVPDDGELARRVHEMHLLTDPSFTKTCADAGFRLASSLQATRILSDAISGAA